MSKIGNYILYALKGDDDECVRIACGIVSDIAGAIKEKVADYLNEFVPLLIEILKDQNRDRMSKL
jgi:hypothetical protein